MSKKNLAFSILLASVFLSGTLMFFFQQARHEGFKRNVINKSQEAFSFLFISYENNIRILNLCRSDTTESLTKKDLYTSMIRNGESSWTGREFFNLLTSLQYKDSTAEDLAKIKNEYNHIQQNIREFYLFNTDIDSINSDEIDSLILLNKKQLLLIEKAEKLGI